MSNVSDIKFMKKVLKIASKVHGLTSPDPAVAAIVVKNNRIISSGYHDEYTKPHAETFALKKAGTKAKGATLYVNLEPCCHFGNNPPCTDNIIKSGITRVVAAMMDPNPLICGKGFDKLKKAGIKVEGGILEAEAKKLNEHFIKHITTKKPFVVLKMAMSLDGKISTKTGDSSWISSNESRKQVHRLRKVVDAVIVGINTIAKDDPMLNIRNVPKGKFDNPLRIIVDSKARISLSSKVLKDNSSKTIIAVTKAAPARKIAQIKKLGAEVLILKDREGKVSLSSLITKLGERNITHVLIEGGGSLAASAIEEKIVDKIIFFIAPIIIGGKTAPTPIEGKGIDQLIKAVSLKDVLVRKSGQDIMIEGYIEKGNKQ